MGFLEIVGVIALVIVALAVGAFGLLYLFAKMMYMP